MKNHHPGSMRRSDARLTAAALHQQTPQIKDLPHQSRASTTLFARILCWSLMDLVYRANPCLKGTAIYALLCQEPSSGEKTRKALHLPQEGFTVLTWIILPLQQGRYDSYQVSKYMNSQHLYFSFHPWQLLAEVITGGVSQQQLLPHHLFPLPPPLPQMEQPCYHWASSCNSLFFAISYLLFEKTNTSLLSKNILKHCQQLST